MSRVPASVLFALGFTESRAGEEPREVVQSIAPGLLFIEREAAPHQLAQALVARVLADRLFRRRVEGAMEHRQATENARRLGLEAGIAQIEGGLDAGLHAFGPDALKPRALVEQLPRVLGWVQIEADV